ncbi:MAG: hypothetical protein M1827_006141 [Pycnora praestabilis]|nr:MAG: hypothetical protein M1827_006141 [Pycnora praestabilis]
MYSPHYSVPPGYVPYGYTTSPPISPLGPHGYYSPRFSTPGASPRESPRGSPKRHSRRASDNATGYGFTSQRMPSTWHSSPGYHSEDYFPTMPGYSSMPRNADYVSYSDQVRSKTRRFWAAGNRGQRASYPQHLPNPYSEEHYYAGREQNLPRYRKYNDADPCFYCEQIPVYTEAESTPHRSRARRPSHAARPGPSPKKPPPAKPPPKATEEDARAAGIPAGYSYKNWDPTEEPIMLLGSVFDANSLGKWIYDWTVFHHGPATPMSEVAGELWLLLIQLAGKIKRAEECMPRIRRMENKEMVEDFLESGERIWRRLRIILKTCEEFMMRAAKRAGGKDKGVSMGKNSGCEFVDSMFGRDRELEKTEKLMQGMRLWSMRFDVNCEDILRRPHA